MKTIKLTDAEINYLLELIDSNEKEGTYWGNKEHFVKRQLSIKNKLKGIKVVIKRKKCDWCYKQKDISKMECVGSLPLEEKVYWVCDECNYKLDIV